MSDTYTNPLAFIFGTKPGGAVPTYEQLQTRRKIAAAMMSQRQPYPKNLGEGLAAIGDALGARGYYNSLETDEAAKGVQDQALLKGLGIGGDQQSPTTTPSAVPSDTTSPVVTPPAVTPPAAMSPRYAPSDDTDTTTAPPVAAIEKAITTPVPTQAAPPTSDNLTNTPASDQPPSTMFSPTPISQQPMSDLAPVGRDALASTMVAKMPPPAPPDQRLAFNGPPAAAPVPAAGIPPAPPVPPQIRTAPSPTAVPAQLRAPTTEPVPPARPAPTPEMQRVQAALSTVGDPAIRGVLQNRLQQLQQDQDKFYAQQQELYQHKRDVWEQAPQKQQELTKAATEARFGGAIPYQQFIADMSKGYDATQQVANGLPTIRQAKDALAQSYTGSGADAKLDASKMLRTMGVPGNYSATEATEVLRSRLKAIAGGLIKATVGSQNISDADRAFVEEAYSGKLSMEPGSLRRLLDISQNVTTETINRHNDRLLGVANDPEADRAIRNTYRVPMQYAPADVSYLKEHPDASNAAKFDARYGKGHARAVLGGANYGE